MLCAICNTPAGTKVKEGKFSFISCAVCDVKYHYPIPTGEELISWYSKTALAKRWKGNIENAINANYKQNRGNYRAYLDLIRDVPANGNVALDVGCYAGHFLTHLIKRGFTGIGIDLNQGLVEYGKKTFGIDLRHGDIAELAFESSSFDLITCHQVLEHVRNPAGIIGEAVRILKPGGFLALSVPDAGCNKKITYPEHIFHFQDKTIKMLFNKFKLSGIVYKRKEQLALFALGRKN